MLRVLFILIGLLLACTALAKLHLLLTDPFADSVAGWPKCVLWLAIAVEFGGASVALSDRLGSTKSLILAPVFLLFSAVSLAKHLQGVPSCGCAGLLSIRPLYSSVASLAIALILFSEPGLSPFRKRPSLATDLRRSISQPKAAFLVSTAASLIAIGALIHLPAMRNRAVYLLLGESIDARSVFLQQQQTGRSVRVPVRLNNCSPRMVRLLGEKLPCNFEGPVQKGINIPPFASAEVDFTYKPVRPGQFSALVEIYVDSARQHVVATRVSGFVN